MKIHSGTVQKNSQKSPSTIKKFPYNVTKTINFDAFLGQANMKILFLTFSQKEHTSILILYENVFGTP